MIFSYMFVEGTKTCLCHDICQRGLSHTSHAVDICIPGSCRSWLIFVNRAWTSEYMFEALMFGCWEVEMSQETERTVINN